MVITAEVFNNESSSAYYKAHLIIFGILFSLRTVPSSLPAAAVKAFSAAPYAWRTSSAPFGVVPSLLFP